MPLLDHFRPPLKGHHHWESFHNLWAGAIAGALNGALLPAGYFAEVQVHIGSGIEVDVATFEEETSPARSSLHHEGATATATLTAPAWAPPRPALTMPAEFPDDIEVQVFSVEGGPTLVAAVELVSPGNKDRDEARRAFAAKCDAYLQRGVGLVVVDIVTSRRGNLHDELVGLLGLGEAFRWPFEAALYAVAYRPVRRVRSALGQTEVWLNPLDVGGALPTLPLALRDGPCLPLDLEATYSEARQKSRLA